MNFTILDVLIIISYVSTEYNLNRKSHFSASVQSKILRSLRNLRFRPT